MAREEHKNMTYDDLIRQAEKHCDAREDQDAIQCATQAIGLDNTQVDGYYWRGLAYRRIHDRENSVNDAHALLACTPRTALHFAYRGCACCVREKYENAIAECLKALEQDSSLKEAYCYRGWAYYGLKDFDRAIDDLNRAIELDPEYAAAYNNRGNAYYSNGDYDHAIEDYGKAIELDPKKAAAYYNRGVAYYKNGDHDRAIEDYGKAIELDPKDADAYYHRGNAYSNKGDHDRAIEDYGKAIELDPKDAVAYNNLAVTYSLRGDRYSNKGDYDHAIKDYVKALEFGFRDTFYHNDFLDTVENYGECLSESEKDKLRGSPHRLVKLVGDILHANQEKEHYLKYIRLIREVYRLQETLEKETLEKEKEKEETYFYQYTEKEPFVSAIRENPVIWLTPACYQNDPDEGKCIFDYFASASSGESLKTLMKELACGEHSLDVTFIAFIRSFSECKDELQMWNSSYAKNGAGVSLGVPVNKLAKANARPAEKTELRMLSTERSENRSTIPASRPTEKDHNLIPIANLHLAKILYLKPGNKEECLETIKGILEEFDNGFLASEENRDGAKEFLPRIFQPISHLVKKDTYKHEKEWRLLYITSIQKGKDDGYLQLDPLRIETEEILFNDKENKEELWLGPKVSAYPDLERLKIKHLFEYEGKGDFVDIQTSKVRFRG